MITKWFYLKNVSQCIQVYLNEIIQLGLRKNEKELLNNFSKFCELDYIVSFKKEDYNTCSFNKMKIKRLSKNIYLINGLIIYCTNRKYVYYLQFIQQICKECFNLIHNNRLILKIQFSNKKVSYVGRYEHKDNINYIILNKKYISKNDEFTLFYILLHEYLHFLLSLYSFQYFFIEGLIELLINQNLKIKCYSEKCIKSYCNSSNGNIYLLLKLWVMYLLRDKGFY